MGEPYFSVDIQINIWVQNPSQEHPVSSKAEYWDLSDMDVLYTFKIKIESWYLEIDVLNTSDYGRILSFFEWNKLSQNWNTENAKGFSYQTRSESNSNF